MADFYKINPLVLIGIPTLEKQPISWEWSDAYASLQLPLGCSHVRQRVENELVGNARNIIAQRALDLGADYVLYIADDVIPPPNIYDLLARHKKQMVTGVYWTKSFPHSPYIWNGLQRGPHTDWKYGEFFKIDWAGVDALLVHTDVFRTVPYPWFSHEWTFDEDRPGIPLATEDLFFYTKARKYGIELWCDAACQCLHQDRATKNKYGLSPDMPQHEAYKAVAPAQEEKLYVAHISIDQKPEYPIAGSVVKWFCMEPSLQPHIVCDVRAIPEAAETFDTVIVKDVLQHYFHWEAQPLLKEWARILKVGGAIQLEVPDVMWAAHELIKAEQGQGYDGNKIMGNLYGSNYEAKLNAHESINLNRCGYTSVGLHNLLSTLGCFQAVFADAKDGGKLVATAKKTKSTKSEALLPIWRTIAEREGLTRDDSPISLAREAISRGAVQHLAELSMLAKTLKERKPKVVVEIGTELGGSLWMFCQLADDDATVISIDKPGAEFSSGFADYDVEKFIPFAKANQKLSFIRDDSHLQTTKEHLLEFLQGQKIDFLFIDGDHRYEGVKQDFEMYSELVAIGGLIAFHDIVQHPLMPTCRVVDFWKEIKKGYKTQEFLDPIIQHWGGIGLLVYSINPEIDRLLDGVELVDGNGKLEEVEHAEETY